MTNMTHKEFEALAEFTQQRVSDLLTRKSQEYSTDDDRFHNFAVGQEVAKAMFPEIKQSQIAFMFALKHIVSVMDMINADNAFPEDRIHEKIDDIIAYLILIKAMLIKGN